jgi:hypothetical protein
MQTPTRAWCNGCRYTALAAAGRARGHYESWFQRANHPTKPQALWIRYTIFSPAQRPEDAVGELWAVYFDGEAGAHVAVRERFPLRDCAFDDGHLKVRVGDADLDGAALYGQASAGPDKLAWELRYTSPKPPLLLLPQPFYARGFPKAKALVGSPLAVFNGQLTVNGQAHDINGWVGSQNHNWGSRHTDRYAWGQVAGFDDHPNAFFECATAQVKLGPISTPWISLMVLRVDDQAWEFNTLWQGVRARASYTPTEWTLSSTARSDGATLEARFSASPADFVALPYDNPPGGVKVCLNSKLAACALTLRRPKQPPLALKTAHRAAFEVLTDAAPAETPLRAI